MDQPTQELHIGNGRVPSVVRKMVSVRPAYRMVGYAYAPSGRGESDQSHIVTRTVARHRCPRRSPSELISTSSNKKHDLQERN